MSAALDPVALPIDGLPIMKSAPVATTLLDLVEAVSDAAESEDEVIATVAHMLRSGKVRLTGCLRGTPCESLLS